MLDVKEAVRTLKQLRCNNHFTITDIYDYHACLNAVEEALCDNNCVIVDLSAFNTDSPEECYKAIQAVNKQETYF